MFVIALLRVPNRTVTAVEGQGGGSLAAANIRSERTLSDLLAGP